ncbi:hypothetical protein [Mariluticola halotolerans]|nr:hypothetical protein [Mariluticola halotolerans]
MKVPVGTYTRESIPLLVAVSIVTMLLIFLPDMVLFLPNLMFNR